MGYCYFCLTYRLSLNYNIKCSGLILGFFGKKFCNSNIRIAAHYFKSTVIAGYERNERKIIAFHFAVHISSDREQILDLRPFKRILNRRCILYSYIYLCLSNCCIIVLCRDSNYSFVAILGIFCCYFTSGADSNALIV